MAWPDLNALFSREGIAELQGHCEYEAAIDGLAAGSLRQFADPDPNGRWIFRDLGRSTLYFATVLLDASDEGVTASALASVARANRIASRGRAMAFLRHAEAACEMVVPPGEGPWTQRRLVFSPSFLERFRAGNMSYARMAAIVAPEIMGLIPRMGCASFFRRYVHGVGRASEAAATVGARAGQSQTLFLERDCGMTILFRLMLSQDRPRDRLLVSAGLSRAALSREFDVSRAHINRLLADAASRGLLSCPAPDVVQFSAILSRDVDLMLAQTLQITRAALMIAESES